MRPEDFNFKEGQIYYILTWLQAMVIIFLIAAGGYGTGKLIESIVSGS